jgi:hypothetical protein
LCFDHAGAALLLNGEAFGSDALTLHEYAERAGINRLGGCLRLFICGLRA